MNYPTNFNYPQYQTPLYPMQQMTQMQPQAQPTQMQSGGFMSVRTEQEARNYPVAPGNVMTFKIENQPYVCEKAQGFSQLEGPIFNKYRLVKEEDIQETVPEPTQQEEKKSYEEELRQELNSLKEEVNKLKEKLYSKSKPLRNTDSIKGGHKE